MPNIGRCSRGCYTCRARRIKCDRGEPGCRKCKVFGRPCPGYRDEASLQFRDQNEYARFKVMTRPYRPANASTTNPNLSPGISLAIPQSFPVNSETQCIDQFFSQYVMAEGRTGYGYMDFIPSICASPDALPCLKSALPAAALASAAKQLNQPGLLWRAREKYGETLNLVNRTLRGPPELITNDSIRLTVLLLGCYEMITGEGYTNDFWDSHYNGRVMLLRMGWEHLGTNRSAWNLFRVLHTQLLVGCILRRSPPPADSTKWLKEDCLDGPVEKLQALLVEVIRIVAFVQGVDAWPEPSRSQQLYGIMQYGVALDQRLVQWAESLPPIWNYTSIPNRSTALILPKSIHVHEDLLVSATWNHWRSIRIRLLQTMTAIAEFTGKDTRDPASQLMIWRKEILDLADDVCSTTPYVLGEIDGQGIPRGVAKGVPLGGFTLLYPLCMISTIEELTESHRRWIDTKLTYIANVQGIGQANLISKLNKMRMGYTIVGHIGPVAKQLMPSLEAQRHRQPLE